MNFSVIILTLAGSILLIWLLFRQRTKNLEEKSKRLAALRKLDEVMMSSTTNLLEVAQKVTDAVAFELGFEIGVLALLDEGKGVLRRVAMSRTHTGIQAKSILPIKYEKLEIPIHNKENLAIKVLYSGKMEYTTDLYDVFVPVFSRELSRQIQETVKIKTSLVYPVIARGKRIGTMIVSTSKSYDQLSEYDKESIPNLVDVVGIALDNAMLYENLQNTTQQLKQANIKLQDLDKLKDDFVSVASHELRTPMTAIRSYAWMALHRADVPLTDKMKKYLSRVIISTERLINLVNDMLNVSRIEAGNIEVNPRSFDIVALARDVVDEVTPKGTELGLKIAVEDTQIPKVFADSDKIHEVLLNLVGNALKFTPSGGSITVSFFSDGQVVETSVKDTGSGITKDDLGRLFQKFGRLDNSYVAMGTTGGTGLGLFISKNLVNMMHGKIWAKSDGVGKGATFTFSLPVASQEILAQSEKYHIRPEGEAKELEPVAI